MTRSFLIFLCLMNSTLFARTLIIGNGSGSVKKTDMRGLESGDTIAIRAGTYSYSQFSNLSGITIVNYRGLVVFAGQVVEFANNSQVVFTGTGTAGLTYGFSFSGQSRDAILTFGNHTACTWSHIEFRNCTGGNGVINPQTTMLKYDGIHDSTKEYYRCHFVHLHLVNCSSLMGNYHGPLINVQDSCEYAYILVDSSGSPSQINATSFYRADIHHWILNGILGHQDDDVGIFQITGNARIHHCKRSGHQWGWFLRLVQLSLDSSSDSYVYDNIDLGTDAYGFVDYRGFLSPPGISSPAGARLHVCNNTVGNYKNLINYVTPVLLNYGTKPFTAEVINNLRFHSRNAPTTDQADTLNIIDYGSENTVTATHNLYIADPIDNAVLKDTVDCYLESGSPAIDAGASVSFIQDDFDGVKRPQGRTFDIGAREYKGPGLRPIRENIPVNSRSIYWLIFPVGILAIAVFFITGWIMNNRRKKLVGS